MAQNHEGMGGGRGGLLASFILAMEAEVVREAIVVCIEEGFQNVIVKSDSSNLILMLRGERMVETSIESICFDILKLPTQLEVCSSTL